MQVFTPFQEPKKNAKCLDNRRLNKQILEICQILAANLNTNIGWKIPKYIYTHPCSLLWFYDSKYLLIYLDCLLDEYKNRYARNHAAKEKHKILLEAYIVINNFPDFVIDDFMPDFLTDQFCIMNKGILLKKDFEYYKNKLGI